MLDDAKLEKLLEKIKRRKIKKKQIFGIDSVIYQEHELKLLLFHYQHRTNRCEKCHQVGFWNKKPLEMFVYRKNKNPKDNRLENVLLMCPNCYSQTDSQKVWIKHKHGKMGTCIDCGKKFRKPKMKKLVDPCADIGTEKSNYIDTRPQVKKGGEIRTRCPRCLEVQIQKKDYTKLNKIKREVNEHLQVKMENIFSDTENMNEKEESLQNLVKNIENQVLLSDEELDNAELDEDSESNSPDNNQLKLIII